MDQNVSHNDNRQPCFRKVIGNTTFVVRVHFSETSKVDLQLFEKMWLGRCKRRRRN